MVGFATMNSQQTFGHTREPAGMTPHQRYLKPIVSVFIVRRPCSRISKRQQRTELGLAEDHAKAFFEEFRKNSVDTILLPLANLGYVHGDLRPGYSEVHNIVLSKEHEKMVFLDYESICHMTTVRAETNKNLPHVENDGVHESIRARLWLSLQCIGIVFAWNCQVEVENFHRDDARDLFTQTFP